MDDIDDNVVDFRFLQIFDVFDIFEYAVVHKIFGELPELVMALNQCPVVDIELVIFGKEKRKPSSAGLLRAWDKKTGTF